MTNGVKKFTAEEFNKQPAPVYRAADKDGSVEISHTHYPDSVFVMELKDVGAENELVQVGDNCYTGKGCADFVADNPELFNNKEYKQDE